MPDAPAIIGVSEIVLSVANLPQMRKFYIETMGFRLHSELSMETETVDPEGKPTITFLVISETDTPLGAGGHPQFLVLIDYQRHVHARTRLAGHNVKTSTLNHLAFEISPETHDLHAQHLANCGVETTYSDFPAMNARAIFLRDPEGNTLELISHHAP